jgi:peptidoglycan/xylan/chitin deacetylase (PgdA/CDA1 family)
MSVYSAAYDTESPNCLAAVRKIVEKHEEFEMPATFFLVARTLEENEAEYFALLGNHPLFEVGCHTYTHAVLRDTPSWGRAVPVDRFRSEIVDSKKRIEDAFGIEVRGFRPAVCSVDALTTVPEALALIDEAGYRYVSSLAWGPDWSLPALLNDPFNYAEQGFPDLWEIPPCGWHENLLKGNNKCGPVRVGLFPPAMPEAFPAGYVQTPREEFEVNNKPFIDKALRESAPLVSLIWHPWSLGAFDPEMEMLEITFSYVRELGMETATFAGLAETLGASR